MRPSAGHSCVTMTAKERTRCKIYPINPGSQDLWARLKDRQMEACCVDHSIRRHPLILINEIPKGLRYCWSLLAGVTFSPQAAVSLWLDDETSLHTSIHLVSRWSLILLCWYWCRLIWINFDSIKCRGEKVTHSMPIILSIRVKPPLFRVGF